MFVKIIFTPFIAKGNLLPIYFNTSKNLIYEVENVLVLFVWNYFRSFDQNLNYYQ